MDNKSKSRWVIFCGGPIGRYADVRRALMSEDYIVCADSGLRHAERLGLHPDLLLGDFDSYTGGLPAGVECIRLSASKDFTDTHCAIEEGLRRGFQDFLLCGALGGRPDHGFANLCSLKAIDEAGGRGKILTDGGFITLVTDGCLELTREEGAYVSIFPFGSDAQGVTLEGFQYPLTDYHMRTAVPIGVSNEQAAPVSRVRVKKGTLLVMVTVESRLHQKDSL